MLCWIRRTDCKLHRIDSKEKLERVLSFLVQLATENKTPKLKMGLQRDFRIPPPSFKLDRLKSRGSRELKGVEATQGSTQNHILPHPRDNFVKGRKVGLEFKGYDVTNAKHLLLPGDFQLARTCFKSWEPIQTENLMGTIITIYPTILYFCQWYQARPKHQLSSTRTCSPF